MSFMTGLSLRKGEQNIALLAGAATGEVTIDGSFCAFVGEVPTPTAKARPVSGSTARDFIAIGHTLTLSDRRLHLADMTCSVVKMLFFVEMPCRLDLESAVFDIEVRSEERRVGKSV